MEVAHNHPAVHGPMHCPVHGPIRRALPRSPWNLLCVQVALQQYHDHLGRFSAIFSEYEPPEYEEVQELYQLAREIELKKVTLTPTLTLTLTLPLPLTLTLTRSTSTSTARRASSTSARC